MSLTETVKRGFIKNKFPEQPSKLRKSGPCSRCGQTFLTELTGIQACKWGGCNGEFNAGKGD